MPKVGNRLVPDASDTKPRDGIELPSPMIHGHCRPSSLVGEPREAAPVGKWQRVPVCRCAKVVESCYSRPNGYRRRARGRPESLCVCVWRRARELGIDCSNESNRLICGRWDAPLREAWRAVATMSPPSISHSERRPQQPT